MDLSDKQVYREIIGSIIKNPKLLLRYDDIKKEDFDEQLPRMLYIMIRRIIEQGEVTELTPTIIDLQMCASEGTKKIYESNFGTEYLVNCVESSNEKNFDYFYKKLKKLSLLRELKKNNYDISKYYKDDFESIKEEEETIDRFDAASVEEILNDIEGKFNDIKASFLSHGYAEGDAASGLRTLIKTFKTSPDIGPELCGDYYNTIIRGARQGTFVLRSSSSSTGKSRLAVFDSVKIAFPVHWSHNIKDVDKDGRVVYSEGCGFVKDLDKDGKPIAPRKVLFVTTEMDADEIRTIILAALSGVNEEKILTGMYEEDSDEAARIDFAIQIMEKFRDYYYLEQISDPDLNNVSAVLKKYITFHGVKYIFFDYIFSSPALLAQFQTTKVREDVLLGLMSNQLKQIAVDYNVFIASSTQVNTKGIEDEGFKDESCIRGARAIADKIDVGTIYSRVQEKDNDILKKVIAKNNIFYNFTPTHYFDLYKCRRGRYKNVRIWSQINLGTGQRTDLCVTGEDCYIIDIPLINTNYEQKIINWETGLLEYDV